MKYRIAIIAHGRFTTIQLAKALLVRGHDVHLFTNYPGWAVPRFGFPKDRVSSCPIHGIVSRGCWMIKDKWFAAYPERLLHEAFGRWAANAVTGKTWDIVYCYSGGAEEVFEALAISSAGRWLARGSSHIRTQASLLEEEQRRAGVAIDRPSAWMIGREEREYQLADVIVTQSTFAAQSFPSSLSNKLLCIPLGVEIERFRVSLETVEARRRRILDGSRLRVLFVGMISYRKGLIDLAEIARVTAGQFQFRFVGSTDTLAIGLANQLKQRAEVSPAVPEAKLPDVYAWADVFVFPTIEDGFAMVLAQAQASALPILATTNCAAPDFIHDAENGWVLPIRSPTAFVQRLEWCNRHRKELASMVTRIHDEFRLRTWDDVARDHEEAISKQRSAPSQGEASTGTQ